jgi:hypothetical protein
MTKREFEPDDWRLSGHKTHDGSTWHHRSYFIWSPTWDHDHCSFCGASFEVPGSEAAQGEDVRTEGWTSEDEYEWICDVCFADFRDQFHWQVRAALPADHADTPSEEG